MAVHTALRTHAPVLVAGVGAVRDDRNCFCVGSVDGADGARRLVSVHHGHLNIHQDQVRSRIHRVAAVRYGFDQKPGLLQDRFREHTVDLNVFHQQNAMRAPVPVRGCVPAVRFWMGWDMAGQSEGQVRRKGRALALFAASGNGAAHHVHKFFRDRKAQALPIVPALVELSSRSNAAYIISRQA